MVDGGIGRYDDDAPADAAAHRERGTRHGRR